MDDTMMETIRANARYYRLATGLSGAYIGDAIGHDASWVQQFEESPQWLRKFQSQNLVENCKHPVYGSAGINWEE